MTTVRIVLSGYELDSMPIVLSGYELDSMQIATQDCECFSMNKKDKQKKKDGLRDACNGSSMLCYKIHAPGLFFFCMQCKAVCLSVFLSV